MKHSFHQKKNLDYSRNNMKIKVTVVTQAKVMPTKPLATIDLYNMVKSIAGNSFVIEVDDSKTVQELADATDALMNVDPSLTVEEKLMDNGNNLTLGSTLAAAGVKNNATIKYSYVLTA